MEPLKDREQKKYYIIENVIDKYFKDCFWKTFENMSDGYLLEVINSYLNSDWSQKKEYSNRIYLLLINNKNREESDNINRNFEKFLNLIDNHRSKNKGLLDILQINNTENLNKVKYIKENSDINDEILRAAESVYSLSNKYNFLYQLWITETTIRLAKISNMDKKDINLLAIIALFNNIWCKNNKDEEDIKENIHNLVKDRIPWKIIKDLDIDINKLYSVILSTQPEKRGQYDDEIYRIIQDAVLEWLWKGPYYLLYSSLWVLEEKWITSNNFIQFEEEFVKRIEKWWEFYLSNAWKQFFNSPHDSIEVIKKRPEEVIWYAKTLIKQNIAFEDFVKKIDEFLEARRLF